MTDPKFDAIRDALAHYVKVRGIPLPAAVVMKIDAAEAAYHTALRDCEHFRVRAAELEAVLKKAAIDAIDDIQKKLAK